VHNKKPTQNPRILKDLLRAKWLKEIKKNKLKGPRTSGLLK